MEEDEESAASEGEGVFETPLTNPLESFVSEPGETAAPPVQAPVKEPVSRPVAVEVPTQTTVRPDLDLASILEAIGESGVSTPTHPTPQADPVAPLPQPGETPCRLSRLYCPYVGPVGEILQVAAPRWRTTSTRRQVGRGHSQV